MNSKDEIERLLGDDGAELDKLLARIDEMDAKATPGRWDEAWSDTPGSNDESARESVVRWRESGQGVDGLVDGFPAEQIAYIDVEKGTREQAVAHENIAFMAKARTLLPLMRDVVRELRSNDRPKLFVVAALIDGIYHFAGDYLEPDIVAGKMLFGFENLDAARAFIDRRSASDEIRTTYHVLRFCCVSPVVALSMRLPNADTSRISKVFDREDANTMAERIVTIRKPSELETQRDHLWIAIGEQPVRKVTKADAKTWQIAMRQAVRDVIKERDSQWQAVIDRSPAPSHSEKQ